MATHATLNAGSGRTTTSPNRFRVWRYRHRAVITAYTILTPMVVYFLIFVWLPVLFLFILSVMQWNIIEWPPHFVGLENYRKILEEVKNSIAQPPPAP